MVALTVLVVSTVPLWLVAGRGGVSPSCRGGCARCASGGWSCSTSCSRPRCSSSCSCSGWRRASGGRSGDRGSSGRTTALMRWYLVVMFRAARRVLRLQVTRAGRPAPTDRARRHPRAVAARRAGRLVHPRPRPAALVRPRAPCRAQGHDVARPGDRAAAAPAPGALHLAGPRLAVGERADPARRSPSSPATSTTTTPSSSSPRVATSRRPGVTGPSPRCTGWGCTPWPHRAERMTNVLAPRPGGVLTALEAAPDADVVLVGHTGLDHMLTVADVWRELPMDKEIIMRWWRVPRAGDPGGARRAHRLALHVVGADRRVDRRPPAGRPPARPAAGSAARRAALAGG